MSLQKEEKLPILSTTSVRSLSFSARVTAEPVLILGAEETGSSMTLKRQEKWMVDDLVFSPFNCNPFTVEITNTSIDLFQL